MHAIAAYEYQNIQVSVTQNIFTVTLNLPQKKNALSFKMINELIEVAEHIRKDKS